MKRKYIGIILGIILTSILGFLAEIYSWGMMICDGMLNEWADHYISLIFLIPLLIIIGIIINLITKTEGVFEKLKEGSIVGFASGLICYLALVINGVLPESLGTEGSALLNISYAFPILIFLPLFMGFLVFGEILLFRKKDYKQHTKVKTSFAIILTLILMIVPIVVNNSLANERKEIIAEIFKENFYPDIHFIPDPINKTLTVANIIIPFGTPSSIIGSSHNEAFWVDFKIVPENNSLPDGTVDVGDKITNCSDTGSIAFLPTQMVIYSWDFTKDN
jgi:hypothetical protein